MERDRSLTPLHSAASDEIGLIDLWIVFARHKLAFWLSVAVFLAAGVAAALLIHRKYEYTTLVEIGAQVMGDNVEPIETPESVVAKLKKSYVPQAQDAYYKAHPDDDRQFEVAVTTPQNSSLVELSSKGRKENAEVFSFIHGRAVKLLRTDHAHIIDIIKQSLQTQLVNRENKLAALKHQQEMLNTRLKRLEVTQKNALANAEQNIRLTKAKLPRLAQTQKNRLGDLQAQAKVLAAEIKSVDQSERLVKEQIDKYQSLVDQAETERAHATGAATDATRTMTLLTLTNQIQQARSALADLQERLAVDLPNRREELQNKLEDNRREQEDLRNSQATDFEQLQDQLKDQQRTLDDLKTQQQADRDDLLSQIEDVKRQQKPAQAEIQETKVRVDNLRQTHAVAIANQSIRPQGLGPVAILVGSFVLGIGAGFFFVFFLEMRSQVQARFQQSTD